MVEQEKSDKAGKYERGVQIFAGYALFIYTAYLYQKQGYTLDMILSLSITELFIAALPFTFAAILVKAFTVKQILDLVKAWKGK